MATLKTRDAFGNDIHLKVASGTGAIDDPITLATANDEADDTVFAHREGDGDVKYLAAKGAGTEDDPMVIVGNGGSGGGSGPLELVDTAIQIAGATGDARGAYANDLQTTRAGGQQVASGSHAVVAGGSNNTAEGGHSVVVGGYENSAIGGTSVILGGEFGVANLYGQEVFASGYFDNPGDAQRSVIVLTETTTNENSVVMTVGNGNVPFAIQNGHVTAFVAYIVAIRPSNKDAASFIRSGCIKRNGATVSLVGAVSTLGTDCADAGAADWTVNVQADDFLNILEIAVTGEAGATIHWFAKVEMVEVG